MRPPYASWCGLAYLNCLAAEGVDLCANGQNRFAMGIGTVLRSSALAALRCVTPAVVIFVRPASACLERNLKPGTIADPWLNPWFSAMASLAENLLGTGLLLAIIA